MSLCGAAPLSRQTWLFQCCPHVRCPCLGLWYITWPRLCNWDKVSKTCLGLKRAAKALSQTTAECVSYVSHTDLLGVFHFLKGGRTRTTNSWEHKWILCFISTFSNPRESVAPFFLLVREAFSGCVDYYPIYHSFLGRISEIKFSGNHKTTKSRGITSSANRKHPRTWAKSPVSGSILTSGLCLFFLLGFLLTPSACEQGRTHRHMGGKKSR